MRLHGILRAAPRANVLVLAQDLEDLRHGAERLQQTLYRLYQIGLIEPWTVTDWGQSDTENAHVQAVELTKLTITFADACRNVAKRITAIDGKSADLSTIDSLLNQSGELEDWNSLIKLLLGWVRRKHLDSRLQSTWNLYSKCVAFTEENAATFRDELEAFFKVDSQAFQLASFRDMPLHEVIPVLEILILNASKGDTAGALRRLAAQLARLLEGTQESPGLNLSAAFLLLITDEKAAMEAKMRFDSAVKEGALAFWEGQGRSILASVASANPTACDTIGEWLVREAPDRQTLIEIRETIPAQSVEHALFDNFASELAQVI
jgi:ATP-dependent DNA helicase RecQ